MSDHHHDDPMAPIVNAVSSKVLQQIYNPETQRHQTGKIMFEVGEALRSLSLTNYINTVAQQELIAAPKILSDGSVLIIIGRETKITGSQLMLVTKVTDPQNPEAYNCFVRTFVILDSMDLSKTNISIPNDEQLSEIKRQIIAANLTDRSDMVLNLVYQKEVPPGIPVFDPETGSSYIAGSDEDPRNTAAQQAPQPDPIQDPNVITDIAPVAPAAVTDVPESF